MSKPGDAEVDESPEPIEAEKPICPHCGFEYGHTNRQYAKIDCRGCDYSFEVERVYISRPLENRK
jgi:transposase-like protein